MDQSIVFSVFLIFTGAAVLATAALYARQSMLVAYILLGMLIGPSALGLVNDVELLRDLSHVGIVFLLFLLGLNLHPQDLWRLLGKATFVTLGSSLLFALLGGITATLFGYNLVDSLVIGAALMFSSTIIGLKLLPSTVLHHQHTGEIIISVLLLQDLIAILIMLVLHGMAGASAGWEHATLVTLALPAVLIFAFAFSRYVLTRLLARFDTIQEYIFLLAIGWCLGMAELAQALGLSAEIGAFIAGIAVATEPISRFIAERLKPLRDFFLVVFFFSLGAGLEFSAMQTVLPAAIVLALISLVLKPPVFKLLWVRQGETAATSAEVGARLGQISEFSLLIAVLATQHAVISMQASYLIQLATLITFIVSSYFIVLRYPTPMAVSDRLRRD
ncbi:transporter (CPA2 family) [Thiogranum longum]|uniref:Transporter (CPA2 family) n=1 Tax=Thiogranum longum TaxID=1537524 RepID=A0A4R1H9P2_9GAMM|nr:cation:proton antiporter [Thiogranum longum]TCK17241.1 transporter (CPA2 family) [Thiogranum longum]